MDDETRIPEAESEFQVGNPETQEDVRPERPERRLRNIFNEALSWTREVILDGIEMAVPSSDEELETFMASELRSDNIGRATREYLQYLQQQAIRKPDKEYVPTSVGSIHEFKAKYAKDLLEKKRHLPKAEFEGFKQALIRQDPEGNGELREWDFGEVGRSEEQKYESRKEDAGLVIHEEVDNKVFKDRNVAKSALLITDEESGLNLDLSELLPKDYKYLPAELDEYDEEVDENGKVHIVVTPMSLKTYQGTQGSPGRPYASSSYKEVGYGDLTKPGGFLALLHEIGHAWQNEYYSSEGTRAKYRDASISVGAAMEFLSDSIRNLEEKKIDKEQYSRRIEIVRKDISQYGIDFDENSFTEVPVVISPNDFVVKSLQSGKRFVVKSERLNQLMEIYIHEERDAWAHAIRALRFLRRFGIDLEPSLHSLNEIRQYVEHGLGSYEKVEGENFEAFSKKHRFSRSNERSEGPEDISA